jgi:hypothetical protein
VPASFVSKIRDGSPAAHGAKELERLALLEYTAQIWHATSRMWDVKLGVYMKSLTIDLNGTRP